MHAQEASDRRRAPRRLVNITGSLYFSGVHLCDCSIRDISETGARLFVPRGQWLPHDLILEARSFGGRVKIEVRWRTNEMVGVKFLIPGD